jgi:ferredoxin
MTTARRIVQFAFLALTLVGVYVYRGHAEQWCPFGGIEALYGYLNAGNLICSLGVSNFYILAAVLLMTLLLRRAFCGYMCPIGTLSEWLQRGANRLGLQALRVPYGLDRGLSLLKYAVLGSILYFTWQIGELVFRGYDPCYVLISRHGTDITLWAYVVSGAIVVASLLLVVPFCRWLCPLAAVLNPFSRFGLARVKRDAGTCLDCGACNRACPMGIRVDQVREVTAARCTSCLDCVVACPERTGGALRWGPPRRIGGSWPQAVLIGILLLCVGGAVAASYAFPLPSFVQSYGERPAHSATLPLRVRGVNCRHSTELFVQKLRRDDEYRVRGYLRVEAWPAPGAAAVRIIYDPSRTNETTLKQAITEPYYDEKQDTWTFSNYQIEGYDPTAAPSPS